MSAFSYIGSELEIFAHAKRWKTYYASLISPFLGEQVLEVGAGMGATTKFLCAGTSKKWVCLEPDSNLIKIMDQSIQDGSLPAICSTRLGTIQNLEKQELFDSILYIDVIEHIKNDLLELDNAAEHLKPNGALIVLSPAHEWLFTPFDKAIGHYRRYSKKTLSALTPKNCTLQKVLYLDSVGTLLSTANQILLRQSMPTLGQILFWDQWIVPISKNIDPLLNFSFGKSILGIWRKS